MENQNTDNAVGTQQPVVESNQFTSSPNEMVVPTSKSSKKLMIVGIVVAVISLSALAFGVWQSNSNKIEDSTSSVVPTATQQIVTPQEPAKVDSNLESLFSDIESTYGGNIPWTVIKNRMAYKFYPKEINGLTVSIDEVSTLYDGNYNPLTVFKLTESVSVPLKNSYISYYEIPDVLRGKFNLGDMDIAMPIELKVYEFDRKLSESEKSIITKGGNFRCTNKESKTETSSFTNEQIVIYYCDINLTEEQKTQVRNKGFFDRSFGIYLVERDMIIQFSMDSAYINNPQDYLSDYISKIFNSNDNLFVTQSQIRTVEDARKFEEWRSKTFDNK